MLWYSGDPGPESDPEPPPPPVSSRPFITTPAVPAVIEAAAQPLVGKEMPLMLALCLTIHTNISEYRLYIVVERGELPLSWINRPVKCCLCMKRRIN